MGTTPHGTVTFLFTDVEGSTRLWEGSPQAMQAALATHDRILRSVIEEHGGHVFSTAGDAFAAAFWTPLDAAEAAVEAQRRLGAESWPEPVVLRVRMGLHTGTADERGGDYFGPAVNRAARLMSVGHGGQVLVSAATRNLLGDGQLVDLGEHRLRDLEGAEHIYQLGLASHPPLRTIGSVPHNLPGERTRLFGREEEIAAVASAVLEDRLVTLTGMGGAGKTRLAVAAAGTVVEAFEDGVWFVDLVPVTEPRRLPGVIAKAIGLKVEGDAPVESLLELLGTRRLLLLMDNCEQVVDATAEIVDMLLERTSDVRVLATSREPLDLGGEHVIPVPPLPVGGDGPSPAVELFMARASSAGASIGSCDPATVRSLCERLDGLPLALELAAAQTVQLTPEELLERLDARFELLATPGRGRARRRQSSLADVLDSTWSLLDPDDRTLLALLAVFPSNFDLEAVEGISRGLVERPAATLRRLVGRALVTATQGGRKSRYRMLETVKLYARSTWTGGGRVQRQRHLLWLAERTSSLPIDEALTSIQFVGWYQNVIEDVRVAVSHALATGQVQLAAHIVAAGGYSWRLTGGPGTQEALMLIDDLRARGGIDAPTLSHLHLAASLTALGARRLERMRDEAELARTAARDGRAPAVEVMALIARSWWIGVRNPEAGLSVLDHALTLAGATGSKRLHDAVVANRVTFLVLADRVDEAMDLAIPLTFERPDRDYATLNAAAGVYSAMLLFEPDLAEGALGVHAETLQLGGFAPDWTSALHEALIAAARGDAGRCLERLDEGIARAQRAGLDGLPDLLLAPAVAAFQRGEHHRAAGWLLAIRQAQRPTASFPLTIIYRQLRKQIVVHAPGPSDADLTTALAGSRRWLLSCQPDVRPASHREP